jgi:Uncharacterized ACR, COG1993
LARQPAFNPIVCSKFSRIVPRAFGRFGLAQLDDRRIPGGFVCFYDLQTPLYEAIVLKVRELHLAGATVLRGQMGFGANSRLYTTKVLQLSDESPLVIAIVDAKEKIDELMPHIDEMV